jgi:hypothetical protein
MNLKANIVQRLFDEGHINAEEAIVLLNDSNKNQTITIPNTPPQQNFQSTNNIQSCKVCGVEFTDYLGRPKVMGFVCMNNNCPTKITN